MIRKIKIILDVFMIILVLTLYDKRFIGMKYHEIAGLVLIAVVAIHIIINFKIIVAMCKSFIKIPPRAKAGVVIDVFLLICFLWIGLSGIFISKTIFAGISGGGMAYKMGHFFAGALSVILLGIHLGLHISLKPMPVAIAIIFSVLFALLGVFGLFKTSELTWLVSPFKMTNQNMAEKDRIIPEGTDSVKGSHFDNNGHEGKGKINKTNERGKHGQGFMGSHNMQMGNDNNLEMLTFAQKAENAGMFFSMIAFFSMLTYWIAVPKKRKISGLKEVI